MYRKRLARPYPPPRELRLPFTSDGNRERHLRQLLRRRAEIEEERELLDAEIDRIGLESICGENDLQHVELYDGTLGVSKSFVDSHQASIANLQWVGDLGSRFNGPQDSAGNVSGVRWGTGGLVGRDLVLTAGHNLEPLDGGWRTPKRNGELIAPAEIATLITCNFNYQLDGSTNQLREEVRFPITELVEHRIGGVDYALVRLGRDANGNLPGDAFPTLDVATEDASGDDVILCLIQHPQGQPKQIEAGPMKENVGGRLTYESLDTLDGSSGAPVLSLDGEVVGVHRKGGCTRFGGANSGVAIGLIRRVSRTL